MVVLGDNKIECISHTLSGVCSLEDEDYVCQGVCGLL